MIRAAMCSTLSRLVGEERILPVQWMNDGGHAVFEHIPEVRLHQAVLMDAVQQLCRDRKLGLIFGWKKRQSTVEIIEWLTDQDGKEHTYAVTFAQAMAVGFPRVNADLVAEQLLSLAGVGPRFGIPVPKITRRHLVRGLPVSVVRSHVRRFRPQVGRGRRVPPEEEALWPSRHAS